MKAENIFKSMPIMHDKESVDSLFNNDKLNIERIVSKGHVSPAVGWYDQSDNEWVLVLTGAAIVSFEDGNDINLQEGDYINILAHVKHKVSWTDPDKKTVWLAVRY